LRRDPKLRLTADELLKHPFFDRYPPCQNTAGILTNEKTVRIFGTALREQEEKGGAEFPFEPPPPPLFGMFVTPEASATRMLVALIKNLNPSTSSSSSGNGSSSSSLNNSARGGMSHGNDGARKFVGLTPEILKRLRAQLPGIDESRFRSLHDRALKGLEGDERRRGLMSWVNQRTK
jgi:serine/threonine protein kinase